MYGLNKDFAAPHTGIVLGASEIIAPIVYTLAMLLIKGISKALAVLSYIMLPNKKLTLDGQALSNAPHVALRPSKHMTTSNIKNPLQLAGFLLPVWRIHHWTDRMI